VARPAGVDQLRTLDEPVTVVFDGRPVPIEDAGSVDVRFASRRGPNAADDDIAELVAEAGDPPGLSVVTSDRDLAARVRARGAEVVGARTFLERLD
jgi:hypothetical protein